MQIKNVDRTINVIRKHQDSEIQKSDFILTVKMDEQQVEINIENPAGNDKKNPLNSFFFYKYNG